MRLSDALRLCSLFLLASPLYGGINGDEQKARQHLDSMRLALQQAKTLTYKSDFVCRRDAEIIGQGHYRVWLSRPNLFRLEAFSHSKNVKEPTGILVGDGHDQWTFWPMGKPRFEWENEGAFAQQYDKIKSRSFMKLIALPPKHSVSHHVEMLGAGLPLTIVNPSIFHGYKDSLDSLIESVRLLVPEQIDNQGCLGFEVHYGRQHRVVRIWIGEKDHLPRRMDLTLQQERRADIIENWSEIAVGNSVAPDLFRWQPPESWTEWSVPHIDSGLLPVGADAPEFELASTDGSKIRLSDYRGKHVLLFHWRLGCPPCIEEIPILEKLFVKHHSAGLVVLGINTTDRKAEVLQTLRKNQVTFRNAANASADAVVVMEKFETVRGLGAVPMTYMISPDGKVLSAWYGCDRQKLERSLFDAGFRGSEAEGG